MLPGIPAANSNPATPCFNKICARVPSITPESTSTIANSSFLVTLISFSPIFNVIPLIPLSETSTLLPFPTIVSGILFF